MKFAWILTGVYLLTPNKSTPFKYSFHTTDKHGYIDDMYITSLMRKWGIYIVRNFYFLYSIAVVCSLFALVAMLGFLFSLFLMSKTGTFFLKKKYSLTWHYENSIFMDVFSWTIMFYYHDQIAVRDSAQERLRHRSHRWKHMLHY